MEEKFKNFKLWHWFLWCRLPFVPSMQKTQLNLFLKIVLEDISHFCEATDNPVLDFWWCLPWVSKPGWTPSCMLSHLCDPQIHLMQFQLTVWRSVWQLSLFDPHNYRLACKHWWSSSWGSNPWPSVLRVQHCILLGHSGSKCSFLLNITTTTE